MIYFIRQNRAGGGAEKYLQRLTKELEKQSISYSILHSNLPKFLPSWIKALIFNRQICDNKKDKFYFSLDRITCADIYRAGDGVHREFLKTKGFTLNPLHLTYLYLEKKTFQNAKKIIANSFLVKKQIIKNYNIPSKKIEVIYNGIPIKEFNKQEAKAALKKEFGEMREPIILFVGSGFKRKGVKEFLEILSKLHTPFKAFIIGKEKKIKWYQNYAKKLALGKKVYFSGKREDVDIFYAASDIFLFPTHYEPFSNVVLEAMSFENVVFTTRQNGASEILPQDFILKSPSDFYIISKIEELLQNTEELKKSQKSMQKIAQNFTIEKNVAKTLEVIEEVLKEKE